VNRRIIGFTDEFILLVVDSTSNSSPLHSNCNFDSALACPIGEPVLAWRRWMCAKYGWCDGGIHQGCGL